MKHIDTTGIYVTNDNWSTGTTITDGVNDLSQKISVDSSGLTLKDDIDIQIGGRSLKEFMNDVEEHLGILRPAPELEIRWDQLKELRQQYEELKADLLEKEKIMDILKK